VTPYKNSCERRRKQNFRCFLSTDIPIKSSPKEIAQSTKSLISPQSRASYSQSPKKNRTRGRPKSPPRLQKMAIVCIPAIRFIATGTQGVLSHENQRCHHGGLFFTYKTKSESVAEEGHSNCRTKSTMTSGL
jgi:hypothetical protein